MTREEINTKLKALIACMKCEVSGKPCDDNCPTQYEAGNMGEIIENLEAISKVLEQEPETVTEFADRCRECGAKYGKALEQTRWIPVSERLPKAGEYIRDGDVAKYYLVQNEYGDMMVNWI